jgi:excisionase family DNA binding protein
MPQDFYRSGQAAKQLGVSSYYVRRLCEAGAIAAEVTAGQQWLIPGAEIARILREGVPDIPVGPDDATASPGRASIDETAPEELPEGLLTAPSDALIDAAEEVKIVEHGLKKRRIEKDAEEVEDWFRERQRRQAALEAEEREKAEAAVAEHRRQRWLGDWIRYALRSRPRDAPREIELEIYQAVQAALAGLHPDQPRRTTQRLVDAAVAKALRPWKRQKDIRSAIESTPHRLPSGLNYDSEWASLKQRATEAAATSIAKLSVDATRSEMEQAAWLAVQPVAREYAHWQSCRNLASWITLPGGTSEENEQAGQAVREALVRLPVGASLQELQRAKDAALEPFRAAIQRREAAAQECEEQDRRERERARQRADVEGRVDQRLSYHLWKYIRELKAEGEIEFDRHSGRSELESDLKGRIRGKLLAESLATPAMSDHEIDDRIDALVDEHIEEFIKD